MHTVIQPRPLASCSFVGVHRIGVGCILKRATLLRLFICKFTLYLDFQFFLYFLLLFLLSNRFSSAHNSWTTFSSSLSTHFSNLIFKRYFVTLIISFSIFFLFFYFILEVFFWFSILWMYILFFLYLSYILIDFIDNRYPQSSFFLNSRQLRFCAFIEFSFHYCLFFFCSIISNTKKNYCIISGTKTFSIEK